MGKIGLRAGGSGAGGVVSGAGAGAKGAGVAEGAGTGEEGAGPWERYWGGGTRSSRGTEKAEDSETGGVGLAWEGGVRGGHGE